MLKVKHLLSKKCFVSELNDPDNKGGNLGKCVHCFAATYFVRGGLNKGGVLGLWVGSSSNSPPRSSNPPFLPPPPRLLPSFIRVLAAPAFSQRLRAAERHMVRTAGLWSHKQTFSTKLCISASSHGQTKYYRQQRKKCLSFCHDLLMRGVFGGRGVCGGAWTGNYFCFGASLFFHLPEAPG